MVLSPTFQAVILGLSAVLTVTLAYIVGVRRRSAPGSLSFTLLLLAAAAWGGGVAFERVALDPALKITWAKLEYLGIATVAPFWFTFALRYTHQDQWLTRRNTILLWIIPVLMIVLAMTNEWHHLIWTRIYPTSDVPGSALIYEHGAGFWAAASYGYLLMLSGSFAMIWAIFRFPQTYRRQAAALLSGIAIPWISNVL